MIPRRLLQQPHGSAADWSGSGTWDGESWTVEMSRRLRTDHPADTTQLTPGEEYTWSPAVHAGAGQRWHWVAYPYKLGLGVEPTYPGGAGERAELVATEIEGEGGPDWGRIETYELGMVFPGVTSWSDLTTDHPRADEIRAAEVTVWDLDGVPQPEG
jgi:hypothetical protein